jgi:perosamine synthetase
MFALGVGIGDEVIVPSMTFVATSNAALYLGARPVFADVRAEDLLIDPSKIEPLISSKTKVIVAVDYGGQPCDYARIRQIAERHKLAVLADGCHSLGGRFKGKSVANWADAVALSFHPVKHITTGEGGMVLSNEPAVDKRARLFRNHGISTDQRERANLGTHFYEMVELGYNYRITDIQCALGLSQLGKLSLWLQKRRSIAKRYDEAFSKMAAVEPLRVSEDVEHAYHLYVVRVQGNRDAAYAKLRARGIGVNVHYVPVHLHPYYRERYGTGPALCPVAESAYAQILSLPMFPGLTEAEQGEVIAAMGELNR